MNHFAERLRFFERMPRVWVVLVCAAALAGLCLYAEREHPMRPLSEYREEWDKDIFCLDGRPVELALPIDWVEYESFSMSDPAGPGGVTVETRKTVYGPDVSRADIGERAVVRGTFRPYLTIEDAEVYVARGRKLKIAASAAAALFVLYLVLRWFRFNRKRGGFVERYHA